MVETTTAGNNSQKQQIYSATIRYARISSRKMNYVAELVRGLTVNRAMEILMFNPRRSSYFLYKLLKSAISNAINKNNKVDVDRLYLQEIKVCGGPIMKRMGTAPRGRAVIIRRRFSHITIFLTEAKETEVKEQVKISHKKEPSRESQEKADTEQSQIGTEKKAKQDNQSKA